MEDRDPPNKLVEPLLVTTWPGAPNAGLTLVCGLSFSERRRCRSASSTLRTFEALVVSSLIFDNEGELDNSLRLRLSEGRGGMTYGERRERLSGRGGVLEPARDGVVERGGVPSR